MHNIDVWLYADGVGHFIATFSFHSNQPIRFLLLLLLLCSISLWYASWHHIHVTWLKQSQKIRTVTWKFVDSNGTNAKVANGLVYEANWLEIGHGKRVSGDGITPQIGADSHKPCASHPYTEWFSCGIIFLGNVCINTLYMQIALIEIMHNGHQTNTEKTDWRRAQKVPLQLLAKER